MKINTKNILVVTSLILCIPVIGLFPYFMTEYSIFLWRWIIIDKVIKTLSKVFSELDVETIATVIFIFMIAFHIIGIVLISTILSEYIDKQKKTKKIVKN